MVTICLHILPLSVDSKLLQGVWSYLTGMFVHLVQHCGAQMAHTHRHSKFCESKRWLLSNVIASSKLPGLMLLNANEIMDVKMLLFNRWMSCVLHVTMNDAGGTGSETSKHQRMQISQT